VPDAPIELIQKVPLFADLDRKELKAVAASMRDRLFPAGKALVEEGTGGVGFFVIESGSAMVTIGGREVRALGPGDHFGEIALLAEIPRTATITATSDVLCYGMTAWDFRAIVEANASIAWKLLQSLGRALAQAEQRT
jgi:CRP-like cAMP-binding protein